MRKKVYIFFVSFSLLTVIAGVGIKHRHKLLAFNQKRPYITLTGPIEMADGIGKQVVELAETLLDENFSINILAHHVNKVDVPSRILSLLRLKNKQLGKIVIAEESLWDHGTELAPRKLPTTTQPDQIRIAYSMLESTLIPPEWVMQLNLYYDAVAVPDSFLVETYIKSGVQIPIFEIPLGVDLQKFLKTPLKKERNPVMVFANFSSALDRKNQLLLVQAFAKALGNVEDAVLQINSRGGDEEIRDEIINEIIRSNCSNIRFTEFKLRKDAYIKLFQSVDCYVSLSKGEGFSIQPREAMALGIPAIVTDNTGQTTICKSNLVKTVKSAILEPARYFGSPIPCGYRFNCDLDEAAAAIKDVYENYGQYLQNAAQARTWAQAYDFSNENLRSLYKTLVKPKKLVLGTENRIHADYLMTNSKILYEKYQKIALNNLKSQPD